MSLESCPLCDQKVQQRSNTNTQTPTLKHQHSNTNTRTPTQVQHKRVLLDTNTEEWVSSADPIKGWKEFEVRGLYHFIFFHPFSQLDYDTTNFRYPITEEQHGCTIIT